ncbi:MAG: hypothetical protein Q4C84_08430 [Bacillota bacterium]|nr:hypothetical protein [Bacillota bacterium]
METNAKNIYKIDYAYANDSSSVYIETDMDEKEVADLIIGLEFYIEEYTKYGEHECITDEMAVYFLCKFYNAVIFDSERIHELDTYDEEMQDIDENFQIDLYQEREMRCDSGYKKYIEKIRSHLETNYVKKLCAFYNDDMIFGKYPHKYLSVTEILKKYKV